MKYRKLRIAWSVGWGLIAVLLCVVFVRSFWRWDQLYTPLCIAAYTSPNWEGRIVEVESTSGALTAAWSIGAGNWKWHISQKLRDQHVAGGRYGGTQNPDEQNGFAGFAAY